jgi:hypothetical protein
VISEGKYDPTVRNRIIEAKPNEPRILVDHDARVCTMLKDNSEQGFVLATWDKIMIELVEDLARVYADTPARVIDFLSIASAQAFESEHSYEMLSILLHVDEQKSARLAEVIEKIKSAEQAYKLDAIIKSARSNSGADWELKPNDIFPLLEDHPEETAAQRPKEGA